MKHFFKTEAELCDAFIAWAKKEGWTVYPETGGFDILLVNADGHQLGIEAKLTLNPKVIDQIMSDGWIWDKGPNFRAILVPEYSYSSLVGLLAHAGIEVFTPEYVIGVRTEPRQWRFNKTGSHLAMFDHNPEKLIELPEYVPTVRAGMSSPVQLTKWKIGALKLMAKLELVGFITKEDCRRFGIDHRRFCSSDGWLKALGEGQWGMGDMPRFNEQHPDTYQQIKADVADMLSKMPVVIKKTTKEKPKQEGLL